MSDPARITIRRRLDWIDTDASGVYHWTSTLRMAEAAETALHNALGIADQIYGRTPRVAVSMEFARSLRFNDEVDITLAVGKLGNASLRYDVTITGPEGVAASGQLTVCRVDREARTPSPWPEHLREALLGAGEQAPA